VGVACDSGAEDKVRPTSIYGHEPLLPPMLSTVPVLPHSRSLCSRPGASLTLWSVLPDAEQAVQAAAAGHGRAHGRGEGHRHRPGDPARVRHLGQEEVRPGWWGCCRTTGEAFPNSECSCSRLPLTVKQRVRMCFSIECICMFRQLFWGSDRFLESMHFWFYIYIVVTNLVVFFCCL